MFPAYTLAFFSFPSSSLPSSSSPVAVVVVAVAAVSNDVDR